MGDRVINSFEGANRFLSNFYPVSIDLDEELYKSVEHAYQAAKTENLEQRKRIAVAATAGEAKRLGRKVTLRDKWNDLRIPVMRDLLRKKFDYPELRHALLETGEAELIEGNYWHDYFWGVCNSRGENHLGKLLMEIRNEYRAT